MNPFLTSLVALACAASLSAQTYLAEDFSASSLPAGWTQVQNGPNLNGWVIDQGGQRLWHEDYTGSTTDNTLVSPVMDLSSATQVELRFDGETNYAQYLANHPNSVGDGISTMEITTDGGLTWTVVWNDTSQASGDTYAPSVDLSAYVGMNQVQLGIHFYGSFAQEWWVDNVVVQEAGAVPILTTTPLFAGSHSTLSVTGAGAGSFVLLGYSLTGSGPTATPYGLVAMSLPIHQLDILTADAFGNASGSYLVPWNWSLGTLVYAQAVDLNFAVLSTPLAVVVQ